MATDDSDLTSLTAFAQLSAQRTAAGSAGLPAHLAAVWSSARALWNARLEADLEAGGKLVFAFVETYRSALAGLANGSQASAPAVVAPTPAAEVPTYLASKTDLVAPRPGSIATRAAPSELDATRELPDGVLGGPALPFGPPAAGPPRLEPQAPTAARGGTGTADIDVTKLRAALAPFRPSRAPELTIEDYARLRARLTVRGEDDEETWSAFGVKSEPARVELRERFAARFRNDPGAQSEFLELVRRSSSSPGPTEEPTADRARGEPPVRRTDDS